MYMLLTVSSAYILTFLFLSYLISIDLTGPVVYEAFYGEPIPARDDGAIL